MKTLGLLGGMSPESTIPYYRTINRTVNQRLGGHHSAPLVIYNVDFDPIVRALDDGRWDEIIAILESDSQALEAAGAEGLVICTNTIHAIAPDLAARINIPLLHIVDPTAHAVTEAGLDTVGLLGTRFTMEEAFFRERLQAQHGIEAIIPDDADRDRIHRVIYDELCLGAIREESRQAYQRIIADLAAQGAQGIILGCTEISLLVGPDDASVPLFDTTELHARYAANWALTD
ncbi:MAG: aspartate/glutamate racemase family protein [Candidatus Bipolaricaulia bacterium]